jgi:hypothetical protein
MKKQIWVSSLVLGLIFILAGLAIYKNNKEVGAPLLPENTEEEFIKPTETINTKYQYKNGEHIFVGSLLLPTPCHSYNVEVKKNNNDTEIAITTKTEAEMCAQVMSEKMFKVNFKGEASDSIFVSLNGEVVNLNIFELPADQDINDIEIFIKG